MDNINDIDRILELVAKHIELRKEADEAIKLLTKEIMKQYNAREAHLNEVFASETNHLVEALKPYIIKLYPKAKDYTPEQMLLRIQWYASYVANDRTHVDAVPHEDRTVSFAFSVKDHKRPFFDKSNRIWHDTWPDKDHPLYETAKALALEFNEAYLKRNKDQKLKKLKKVLDMVCDEYPELY